MTASSSKKKASLTPQDIHKLLISLYKLYKLRKYEQPQSDAREYQYCYDYIPNLAMTGPPLSTPIIDDIKLPNEELPPLKWLLLVLKAITTFSLNKVSYKPKLLLESLSFDVNDVEKVLPSPVELQVQSLDDLEQEIKAADSPEELQRATAKLASLTKDIVERIAATNQSEISFDTTDNSYELANSEIESELREIDARIASEVSTPASSDVSFDLSSDAEPENLEAVESDFKEIIRANAKLAEMEGESDSNSEEVSFGIGSSVAEFNLEDYNRLFSTIPLPDLSSRFQEDSIFAYMRLAGPNPIMLERVSAEDAFLKVVKEQLKEGEYERIIQTSDSLEVAANEGRLYKADYSKLRDMKNGTYPNSSNKSKYVCAPLTLFAVPPAAHSSHSLVPVAIQFLPPSDSTDGNSSLFTPSSGESWAVAKSIVQMADANYHELVSHLGQTHLVIEPFAIATKRKLPRNHPLRILLAPHLQGTILINYGAHKMLIADAGKVDILLAATIQEDRKLAIEGAKECLLNFNEIAFPKTLEKRQVSDREKLPEYPYRDDGLLIWNAIQTWVSAYLTIYYPNNEQIVGDSALQAWAEELVSPAGGRLERFGEDASGAIKTLDYLIEAVSTVIFIASAQHAAVNFPQNELMSYAPAFPLAVYAPSPTRDTPIGDLASVLPPLEQAMTQIGVTYLLGSIYYTQLGQYEEGYFQDEKVKPALTLFQTQLREAEAEIEKRNASRPFPYPFLLPSRIPQSINI